MSQSHTSNFLERIKLFSKFGFFLLPVHRTEESNKNFQHILLIKSKVKLFSAHCMEKHGECYYESILS